MWIDTQYEWVDSSVFGVDSNWKVFKNNNIAFNVSIHRWYGSIHNVYESTLPCAALNVSTPRVYVSTKNLKASDIWVFFLINPKFHSFIAYMDLTTHTCIQQGWFPTSYNRIQHRIQLSLPHQVEPGSDTICWGVRESRTQQWDQCFRTTREENVTSPPKTLRYQRE